MSDDSYKAELGRHAAFLDDLKSPGQRRRASQHPDIARAVVRVESAFRSAQEVSGANDAERYHQALVAVRQAIGAWNAVDAQHGEVSWRRAGV